MRCPRCNTENDNRTVCSKCGYFLYRANEQNRKKMTKSQRAAEDAKTVGKRAGKIFKIVWIIVTIIVLSAWLVLGMVALTGLLGK